MATILNTTQVYNAADVVTHTNLNQIVGGTTFVAGNGGATDNVTLEVDTTTGSLQVKEIDSPQIKADAVITSKILDANVTKAKLENISAPLKVLGRMTAGAGAPEEVEILDDDTMATASATTLATSESIKEYVDTTRSFSKPDFVQAFTQIPNTDTNINVTHNLGTTDLIYFIQMKFPDGSITQMNTALTYPEYDAMKPTGLSVFITTNTFSCRSGRGWAFWRTQANAQTGNSRSQIDYNDSRVGYQFRIIAYKLS